MQLAEHLEKVLDRLPGVWSAASLRPGWQFSRWHWSFAERLLDGGESAGRHVDHAAECGTVSRTVCQAQVRDKVPHFRGCKEIRIGADAEWDPSGAQAQRQRARLSVGAKKHCNLTRVLNLP
jgi:hypothetical protein